MGINSYPVDDVIPWVTWVIPWVQDRFTDVIQICTHRILSKKSSDQSLSTGLHGRSAMMLSNNDQYHQLVFGHNKINVAPIFTVSRINAKF